MKTILIPTNFGDFRLNELKDSLNFIKDLWWEIKEFKTDYFSWVYFEGDSIDYFIPILNGYFWETYFVSDYFIWHKSQILGSYLWNTDKINENIKTLWSDLKTLNKKLSSPFLFTRSQKKKYIDMLLSKICDLSGLEFSLFYLIEKTQENLLELDNIAKNSTDEFWWNAEILKITNETKLQELKLAKVRLANRNKDFLDLLTKYLK